MNPSRLIGDACFWGRGMRYESMRSEIGPKDTEASPATNLEVSRRGFLQGAGGAAAGALLTESGASAADAKTKKGEGSVTLLVNGEERAASVEPRTTLLDALRIKLKDPLTGTKLVCDRGTCGACTVLLDGSPVCSCLVLAHDAVGHQITTVEGLAPDGEMNAVQRAMCKHDGMMCGFCTPGITVTLTAFMDAKPDASRDEIREALSGNFCRCGTYPHVFDAALEAGAEIRGDKR